MATAPCLVNLIFVLFICCTVTATLNSNNLEDDVERSISVAKKNQSSGCECSTYSCGCCEFVNFSPIHGEVCTNFSYLPNDYGISITITYNNYTLINETVSARNPPPFCIGIPELEKVGALVCLRLYDLTFDKHKFHGCLEVKVAVYHIIHKTVTVGCFNLPPTLKHNVNLNNMIKNIFLNIFEAKNEISDYPTVHMV